MPRLCNGLRDRAGLRRVRDGAERIATRRSRSQRGFSTTKHPTSPCRASKGTARNTRNGESFLIACSAYSAVNQGHCHPKILAALVAQAQRLTITSRAFRNDQLGPFYEELCSLTSSHRVLPMNSGAEAVETVLKAVRKWGYQTKGIPEGTAEILVADGNFHGRTLTIIGFSSERAYQAGFGPFPSLALGGLPATAAHTSAAAAAARPHAGQTDRPFFSSPSGTSAGALVGLWRDRRGPKCVVPLPQSPRTLVREDFDLERRTVNLFYSHEDSGRRVSSTKYPLSPEGYGAARREIREEKGLPLSCISRVS